MGGLKTEKRLHNIHKTLVGCASEPPYQSNFILGLFMLIYLEQLLANVQHPDREGYQLLFLACATL
jgi:hypothetical protein